MPPRAAGGNKKKRDFLWEKYMKDVLYEVRCLKSNEDMILALTGSYLSRENMSPTN